MHAWTRVNDIRAAIRPWRRHRRRLKSRFFLVLLQVRNQVVLLIAMVGMAWMTSGPPAGDAVPRFAVRQGPGVVRVLIRDDGGPNWTVFFLLWLPALIGLLALVFAYHLHRLDRKVFLAPFLAAVASLALTTRWPSLGVVGLALGALVVVGLLVA